MAVFWSPRHFDANSFIISLNFLNCLVLKDYFQWFKYVRQLELIKISSTNKNALTYIMAALTNPSLSCCVSNCEGNPS